MSTDKTNLRVDVRSVIKSKNPDLLRYIPGFIINWVERLICQDEINNILDKYGNLKGVPFATATLRELNATYSVSGIDKIANNGRYIIVSNHPLGGFDGMILMDIFGNYFNNKIRFVVNDLLSAVEPLKPIFLPVNKFGKQSVEIAEKIHQEYASDNQIITFPAGLCSRLINGRIIDLEWKKSFVNQAIKYKRDIVPIYFDGKNSNFFYRFANIRKKLGIKFNYELILLPREMFKQRGGKFNIYIGDPIHCEELAHNGTPAEWTAKIRKTVYSLKP
ncbi:MAG: 1-acyl-sn-glycerol-3-phosphate acyltransferase [Rikenellaceae bacterium]|jgi:putative hemolysin|nr:1-acyl-sn-glycerol-3-phosphate acyltransferase [Bacteroidales bacterium]